jgi:hypothetical protein
MRVGRHADLPVLWTLNSSRRPFFSTFGEIPSAVRANRSEGRTICSKARAFLSEHRVHQLGAPSYLLGWPSFFLDVWSFFLGSPGNELGSSSFLPGVPS